MQAEGHTEQASEFVQCWTCGERVAEKWCADCLGDFCGTCDAFAHGQPKGTGRFHTTTSHPPRLASASPTPQQEAAGPCKGDPDLAGMCVAHRTRFAYFDANEDAFRCFYGKGPECVDLLHEKERVAARLEASAASVVEADVRCQGLRVELRSELDKIERVKDYSSQKIQEIIALLIEQKQRLAHELDEERQRLLHGEARIQVFTSIKVN